MVDNFNIIRNYLKADDDNQFYHMQILRRGKDHPDLPAANRVIKAYFIVGQNHLNKLQDEIVTLCELFGARAYINLAPKSMYKLALKTLSYIAERIFNGDFKKIYKAFATCAGELKSSDPHWVVDIDDMNDLQKVKDYLCDVQIFCEIPTKHGMHLITKPFRLDLFKVEFPNIDVHKNNPTILYVPKSLD